MFLMPSKNSKYIGLYKVEFFFEGDRPDAEAKREL